MKNKTKVLYDNTIVDYDEWYKIYQEECDENEEECYDRESNEFYEWVGDMLSMDWDDFITNLEYDKESNAECFVIGSLGLWNESVDVERKFDTLRKAIMECIVDCDYITITETNGVINVRGIHHDGRNYFSIYKLNKKGCNVVNHDLLYKRHYHKKFNIQF